MAGTTRKVDLWPGARDITSHEIDLRKELFNFFRGEGSESGKAHWIVLRHFDKTTPSKYWNPDRTREAVGGPQWQYTDTAVLTYTVLRPPLGFGTDFEANIRFETGNFDNVHLIFFFEHDVSVDVPDHIFEIEWEHQDKPVDLSNLTYIDRYEVRWVNKYRADHQGRIEYKAASCRLNEVTWG